MSGKQFCACCGKVARKHQRAFVLGLGMQHVCDECASWGLLVVSARPSALISLQEELAVKKRRSGQ